MDKESAEAFIFNLVENIFIESESGAVSIKVKEWSHWYELITAIQAKGDYMQ